MIALSYIFFSQKFNLFLKNKAKKNHFFSIFNRMYSHEEFVIRWYLILSFDTVIKVNSCNSTVCVDLNSLALNKFCAKCFFAIFLKIKHNLIPSIIKF